MPQYPLGIKGPSNKTPTGPPPQEFYADIKREQTQRNIVQV